MSNIKYISLGYACELKMFFRRMKLHPLERLPFDFMASSIEFIISSFKENFKQWLDPSLFYSSAIHKPNNHMLIKHKNHLAIYNHDLKYHDYVNPHLDLNKHYDSNGYNGDIPIKPQALNTFIEAYSRRIHRLRDIVNDKNNILIFIRYQNYVNPPEVPIATLDDIKDLYQTLKQFCINTRFILMCISNTVSKWPTPDLDVNVSISNTNPIILFNDEQSTCLIGRYSKNYLLNVVVKNITIKLTSNTLPITVKF